MMSAEVRAAGSSARLTRQTMVAPNDSLDRLRDDEVAALPIDVDVGAWRIEEFAGEAIARLRAATLTQSQAKTASTATQVAAIARTTPLRAAMAGPEERRPFANSRSSAYRNRDGRSPMNQFGRALRNLTARRTGSAASAGIAAAPRARSFLRRLLSSFGRPPQFTLRRKVSQTLPEKINDSLMQLLKLIASGAGSGLAIRLARSRT